MSRCGRDRRSPETHALLTDLSFSHYLATAMPRSQSYYVCFLGCVLANWFPSLRETDHNVLGTSRSTMFSSSSGVLEHLEERSCQWDFPGARTLLTSLPVSFSFTSRIRRRGRFFFYHQHNVTFNLEATYSNSASKCWLQPNVMTLSISIDLLIADLFFKI